MATLADRLKPRLSRARAIPGKLGIRPHSVKLLHRSWIGEYSGDGGSNDNELSLTEGTSRQSPKVRWLNAEEMAIAGLDKSTVQIGPITADHAAREWLEEIQGVDMLKGDARYLVVTGPKHPCGAKYVIKRITCERALHYMIQAESLD